MIASQDRADEARREGHKGVNKESKVQQKISARFLKHANNLANANLSNDVHTMMWSERELGLIPFLNEAGHQGWETTGQVPGFPGPTGCTMMRRRM